LANKKKNHNNIKVTANWEFTTELSKAFEALMHELICKRGTIRRKNGKQKVDKTMV